MFESIGAILGSFLPSKITRYLSITVEIFLIYGAYGLLIPNILFFKNKVILLILILTCGFLTGVLNPQVQSMMITKLPENMIGSIMGTFYTVVQVTIPLGSALFSTTANAISLRVSWLSLLFFEVVTLLLWSTQVHLSRKNGKEV
ncbi:hypothetical protein OM945_04910 [Levilactobacillus namurensis]|nr:hypothetical protein [Levilactobacillus namurensis]MDT7018042.1 hypothetical protein [Levilactobacillus namurensis]